MPDLPLPQADGAHRALTDPLARTDIVVGDLTRPDPGWQVDAIVNAADESLLGGGGVDGAIHRAAGPRLLAFTRTLGGCPTGLAKASPAFDLEAQGIRHIFHTVGPVWPPSDAPPDAPPDASPESPPESPVSRDAQRSASTEASPTAYAMAGAPLGDAAALGYTLEDTLLASCYTSCLRLAVRHRARVVAFPAISTGIYRFPKPRAAMIALGHVFGHFAQRPAPEWPQRVLFCCFDEADAQVYRDALANRSAWLTSRRRPG